ncbi:FMN-binding protein MioC [Thalassotalea sp. M1531]|uniref:FMN-binding protein MioC n=1 Tax=Thalassotalea algicola TaxID=2716224 RepID=A0A7Y0Q645_9GAMM|nr:FMN-binding protein MioC [Thalassotalea algicola]NMP30801.1 FMN-binding protein MioC [Thalassotalea algicola]
MTQIQIIVGSMLGGTEYVAEACQETLEDLGHNVTLHLVPKFDDILKENQLWLICTSTHGAGDYPDNIKSFVDQLTQYTQDLNHTSFAVIGIGDSSYDTFCLAAKNINTLLLSKGCKEKIKLLTLDMTLDIDPEEQAQHWISQHKDQLS